MVVAIGAARLDRQHQERGNMKAEDLTPFLDRPVAVQLVSPMALVDNDGERKNILEHKGHTYGVPQPVEDKNHTPMAVVIVVGVLSRLGSILSIQVTGENGAVIETTLRPEQIAHVNCVTKPGKGLPMIALGDATAPTSTPFR